MADFRKAFETGLAAHDDAERNRSEIYRVIREMSEQLGVASAGRLELSVEEASRVEEFRPLIGMTSIFASPKTKTIIYQSLCVRNPKQNHSVNIEICQMDLSKSGFPVYLTWKGRSTSADNANSLEAAFQQMLQDPDVAGTLKSMRDKSN